MPPSFYGTLSATALDILARAAPDLPAEAWWLPALVIGLLGIAALVDAFTASIPDPLVLLGLLAVTACQGLYVSWPFAAGHLTIAIAAGLIVWGVNQLWYWSFRRDAIGMGDAKWTMLAVSCFGYLPIVIAWGFGACLAVLWMAGAWLIRYRVSRVTFAPFLFLGLVAGLYWVR